MKIRLTVLNSALKIWKSKILKIMKTHTAHAQEKHPLGQSKAKHSKDKQTQAATQARQQG